MAVEIEHKFLVKDASWRPNVISAQRMSQAYLASQATVTVRVRIAGDTAWLTLKGASTGIAQSEFEYAIPLTDARQIMDTLTDSPVIDKTRHTLVVENHEWVVDEFHGANDGLIVAEIELDAEDERFTIPAWAGANVTADVRYRNKYLAHHPYCDWGDAAPI